MNVGSAEIIRFEAGKIGRYKKIFVVYDFLRQNP